jgi:hypothetical protein
MVRWTRTKRLSFILLFLPTGRYDKPNLRF